MTRIVVIRHGTTLWNKEGRVQGHSDIPLDIDGFLEAEKLAERLSREKWDVIISSPLQRAQQTAATIAKKLGNIECLLDERIREAGGGKTEGTTETERIASWGENWRSLDLDIEPVETIIARGTNALNDIVEFHKGKNIVLVSHGAFIRHMLKSIFPEMEIHPVLKNTSVTILTHQDAFWHCNLYNCTIHLEESMACV